jgi:antitoxin FitA
VPTDVSVKDVPDDIIEKLRKRAKQNHRSLQGELMVILEEAAGLSVERVESRIRELRFETGDESASWLRELRDAC